MIVSERQMNNAVSVSFYGRRRRTVLALELIVEERMWFQRLSMLFSVPFASLLQVYSWPFNYLADVMNQI